MSFRENGGELTSALVALLISHCFQLAMSGDYADTLDQARPAGGACSFTVSRGGADHPRCQRGKLCTGSSLTRKSLHDAEWLQATAIGSVLVIGGDNMVLTESSLDINTAARLGTLVTGVVTVRSSG